MNDLTLNQTAYNLKSNLISAINEENKQLLATQFAINEAVFSEIKEELNAYFGQNIKPLKIGQETINVFKYTNVDEYGIEANLLLINNKKTDLTLHTMLFMNLNGDFVLRYRLIEVM